MAFLSGSLSLSLSFPLSLSHLVHRNVAMAAASTLSPPKPRRRPAPDAGKQQQQLPQPLVPEHVEPSPLARSIAMPMPRYLPLAISCLEFCHDKPLTHLH
ncbi:hypothetical protein TRIUR3_29660 [Triticum urartu]|uniref:Uncharacterized protein n=1 Tax=Triticum urartu TaxID=4572 RepID=M8A2J8_TRIUA|nr:hypothetical protein TRIUR3_29660 [Triticum urartu]